MIGIFGGQFPSSVSHHVHKYLPTDLAHTITSVLVPRFDSAPNQAFCYRLNGPANGKLILRPMPLQHSLSLISFLVCPLGHGGAERELQMWDLLQISGAKPTRAQRMMALSCRGLIFRSQNE